MEGKGRDKVIESRMDENMKEFQQQLVELETEAERLLLARHQLVENDKVRNGNREALTALRKRARTTKTSVPSPFESIMREIGGPESRPLVKEVCSTCGNHDSSERTWMMFSGTDVFARIPFHAAHTILETVLVFPLHFGGVPFGHGFGLSSSHFRCIIWYYSPRLFPGRTRWWSAHQWTRSPPSTHKYPHSYLHSLSPSSSRTYCHHPLPFSPPLFALQNHHHDPFNYHHQQQYKSTILPKPRASTRPATLRNTNPKIRYHRILNELATLHSGASVAVSSENYHNMGHVTDLSRWRLSGLSRESGGVRNMDLTENIRVRGSVIFSGLMEKCQSFGSMEEHRRLASSENLPDPSWRANLGIDREAL
ncbi:hypothetical protein TIFTF001_025460 [Ficus carica]|uniref:P53 and DNA damage-regulated protein 1 n=1 Tax=Ficus carica TaxID=3494 RepID=A0AA88AMY6_FICCA|nr:hypothetical protein TIFTF001_025460 [Ficus carica]